MAIDKLVDSSQLDLDLTSVANAIRAKSGGSGVLLFPSGFVSEINSIVAGGPTLDDWLSDLVGSVAFNGQTVKQYAFAYHQGPNQGGIDFSLPNLTVLPTGAIQQTRAKSFSAPLVSSIQGSTFSMLFPASGQGVVVAFPAITTLNANTSLLGFAGQDGTIVPVLLSLPNFTGRTASGSSAPLFGSDSGLIVQNDCGINEITQDPNKNVLPASGVRVYIPLMTSCQFYDFAYLPRLVTAELPNMITIGDYAFKSCTALTTVDLSHVTTLGHTAFGGCTALTSVALPAITSLGSHAFDGCSSLQSVTLNSAFKKFSNNYEFYLCTSLTSIDLSNITDIGNCTFAGCSSLTSVDLSNATYINSSAFQNCIALTSVDIKKTATIGQYTFRNCLGMTRATIRGNGQALPYGCFYNCRNLEEFVIDLNDPTGTLPTLSSTASNVFYGSKITTTGGGYVYVNDDRVNDLKARTNWTAIASIIKPLSELPSA